MIFNIFFSLSCFFIFHTFIKAQDDFTITDKYYQLNSLIFYNSPSSQRLNLKVNNPGILLSISHFDLSQDFNMFYPDISSDNNSIVLNSKQGFVQIVYNYLVLDQSKFYNVQIVHDKVEISKPDKKDEQSGMIEYLFFKDLDSRLSKYKTKHVYAFLTGFEAGNNFSSSEGIAIDLSATVEKNTIKLSIKIRKTYIDINVVHYNYLVQFIDDKYSSQYDIKTIYDKQLNSDEYPILFNGYTERILKIDLEIQQVEILNDFKKFLFIGGNKIDFLITQGNNSSPRFSIRFEDQLVNNKVQFIAKTWYTCRCNGFSIFSFQIYYKECSQTKQYFYQDKCYNKCPIGMYDKEFQCFQCPDNCKYCNETPGTDLKCQECNDSFYNVEGVYQIDKRQEYYCNQKECNVKCGINCIDCQNGADQCNKCQDETLKWDEKSVSCICKLSNQFFNKVKKTCEKCETFCKTCENQANNCTSCGNNTKMDGGKCVCKSGTMFDDEGNCCTTKQKLVEKGQLKICDCIDNTFYFDKAKEECQLCPIKNCKNCSMDGKCSQCNPGYNKFGNGIVCRACGKGIYADEKGDCSKNNKCMKGCFTCLDSLKCLKYDENYTKEECQLFPNLECTSCSLDCKICDGLQPIDCQALYFCSQCEWQCNKCDTSTTFYQTCKCIKCYDGYFNLNGNCITSCPSQGNAYIENLINRTCECKKGYIYELIQIKNKQTKNSCSKTIPLGFFCNNQNVCYECSSEGTCYKCSTEKECAQCIDNYFLWEGKCTKQCYPDLNIMPKADQGICSCPDSYVLIEKSEQDKIGMSKCEVQLKVSNFSIENILTSKEQSTNKRLQNNFITITFNRNPTQKESQGCDFKLADKALKKGKDYKINKQFFRNNILEIELESYQNYKIQECTITINEQSQNILFSQTILVSEDYVKNSDQEQVKQISSTMNNLSEALTVSSNKHVQRIIDFFKTFQLLCYISNFVQLLAPLTLFKDVLPSQAGYGTILGASFVFKVTPESNQLSFESENVDQSDKSKQDYQNTIQTTQKQVLQAFGLDECLYKNFIMVQLSMSIITFVILLCLIARHLMLGEQYTLNIVHALSNFLASYVQGSITVSLFTITLSMYDIYQRYIGMFQIICNVFFFLELLYLFISKSSDYLQKNMPNFFQNINYSAKGAKSYLLTSLLKKYLVITLILTMNNSPFNCTIIIGVIFSLNGLYLVYYRFFEFLILNILKIIQEFIVSSLFFMIAFAIKGRDNKMKSNIISNEDLNSIQKEGKIILILIMMCLAFSFVIFLFRLIITIKDIISKIKKYKEEKEQQKQNLNNILEFIQLDEVKDTSKKYTSNNKINSFRRSKLVVLKKNEYCEKQPYYNKAFGSNELLQ